MSSMDQLTEKQQYTLETIAQFIGQRRVSPTFTELRMRLGISSNQSLIDRLVSLERKGLLVRNPKQYRSISLGPNATEYFRSLEGYITSPIPLATHSQLLGTFNNNFAGNVELANSGGLMGNTITSGLPAQSQ